jgi:hypothetical protein
MMETHQENLERVIVSIGPVVLAFCRQILGEGRPQFNMRELTSYVRRCVGEIAPDSPGRILRELRQKNQLNYKLVSRHASLYLVTAVRP